MPQAPHPGELCQPGFRTPGVGGRCQEIGRSLAEKCARVRPHVLDAILVEPVLHFADGEPMRAKDSRGFGVWCRTPDAYTTSNAPGRNPGRCKSVSTNCTRASPKRRAASWASCSEARVRSAPMTRRSARVR